MRTPWGESQHSKAYGEGITFHSTAGHGGFKVSAKLNKLIPDYLREADRYAPGGQGWYEEDCGWAIVATVFPERFTAEDIEAAKATLRGTYPEQYAKFYGTMKAGE